MMKVVGDHIFCSLGFGTDEVFRAICRGQRGTSVQTDLFAPCQPVCAALIDRDMLHQMAGTRLREADQFTSLEQALLLSVQEAVVQAGIDPARPDVGFVLSSTKGNIELLDHPDHPFGADRIHLWRTAQLVTGYFGNPNRPVTVSNACISGATAQIAARRMLESGRYRTVIVTGGDMLSRFIISGFQSFKALSPNPCKPFDAHREGLNLGEAAGTLVYTANPDTPSGSVSLEAGFSCNDANHISGPSRTGEGSYQCLRQLLRATGTDDVAFVNAHGTATLYNDDMESIALTRTGLEQVPVFSLKYQLGHTLGAAGIIESIVSIHALQQGLVLPSAGCTEPGTRCPLHILHEAQPTRRTRCIKLLSGFGGSNAALLFHLNR